MLVGLLFTHARAITITITVVFSMYSLRLSTGQALHTQPSIAHNDEGWREGWGEGDKIYLRHLHFKPDLGLVVPFGELASVQGIPVRLELSSGRNSG